MKELYLPLSQGYHAIIDAEDSYLTAFKWSACVRMRKGGKTTVYAVREDESGRHLLMHREIMGSPLGDIDHIDGDGLNNRRGNLRSASRTQNNANARKRPGSSQYKGVHLNRTLGKWCAQIKKRHLGVFREECDAATAYNFAATEEFGVFARLNQ